MDGWFGNPTELPAKLCVHMYAVDREAAKPQLLVCSLNQGRNVLCNRYTGSNLGHQAPKLPVGEREEFVR